MGDAKPVLVGWYRSPYVRRVAVSLKHYGVEYDHRPLQGWRDVSEVRAIHPAGRIPILVTESGERIVDSGAILDYLDNRVGREKALMPPASVRRDEIWRILSLALCATDKARELRDELYLRPETLRHDIWVNRWKEQLKSVLELLNACVELPHAAGQEFTQADVTVGVMYDIVQDWHPEILPEARYESLDSCVDGS